jgi:hypothetical protein
LSRRLDAVDRVWLVETGGTTVPAALTGMHKIAMYPAGDIIVALYQH